LKARAQAVQNFGTAEELEEIGVLTMRLTALEESMALFCEILSLRPEMGGFPTLHRGVITKQFGEKLSLYSMLTLACGVLHGIDTKSIEDNLSVLKAIGEDRNAVIHGLLGAGGNGQIVFRSRGHDVQGDLPGLRNLTARCHDAGSDFIAQFSNFYAALVRKKSNDANFEALVQTVLVTSSRLYHSMNTLRASTLKARKAQAQVRYSEVRLAAAKKTLQISKAREKKPK
jgi:hypothetical protein